VRLVPSGNGRGQPVSHFTEFRMRIMRPADKTATAT
jgi:hypothetical protein